MHSTTADSNARPHATWGRPHLISPAYLAREKPAMLGIQGTRQPSSRRHVWEFRMLALQSRSHCCNETALRACSRDPFSCASSHVRPSYAGHFEALSSLAGCQACINMSAFSATVLHDGEIWGGTNMLRRAAPMQHPCPRQRYLLPVKGHPLFRSRSLAPSLPRGLSLELSSEVGSGKEYCLVLLPTFLRGAIAG
ncbi:hypothetical protein EV126DRAFT_163326 [Verticillium dahliae]|nr:hypothetical protein EV126DRAFT_163326 [Verticillium dahliae]